MAIHIHSCREAPLSSLPMGQRKLLSFRQECEARGAVLLASDILRRINGTLNGNPSVANQERTATALAIVLAEFRKVLGDEVGA